MPLVCAYLFVSIWERAIYHTMEMGNRKTIRLWSKDIDPRLRFTADNLSDYSRYFNEYDYTEWNEEMFLEKKELYGMTKWSPKLYQNFSSLCARMMQAIWGYSFFS